MYHERSLSKDVYPKTDIEHDSMHKVLYTSTVESIMYAILCIWPNISNALSVTNRHQANLGKGS